MNADLRDNFFPRMPSSRGWPGSDRNGGRHQIGTVAAIRSEYLAALRRNPHLMLRAAFKLPLRQIEGLMTSVLSLMGLTISAPDHTTVSRRAVTLPVIQATSGCMVRYTY